MKLTEDDIDYFGHYDVKDRERMEEIKQQILDDYETRKAVENRLDMAKTLKDKYMIQLFTDILRGH